MPSKLKRITFCLFLAVMLAVSSCGKKKISLGAEVKAVNGQAYIFRQNAKEWKELKTSSAVDFGDSLKTDGKSQLEVAFGDGNTIKIDENSKIFLSQAADSSGGSLIEVFNCHGSVLSRIEKLPEPHSLFQVRTPMSVARVSGTFFIVTYNAGPRTSHVNVLAGKVRVRNPRAAKGFVVVLPGYFTVISWGRPPGKPVKLNYGQWKKYHRLLGPGYYKSYGNRFKIKHAGKPGSLKKGRDFKGPGPHPKLKGGHNIKPKVPQPKAGKSAAGGGKMKPGKRK